MIGTDARPPLLLVTDPAFAEGVILEVIDRVARAVPAGSFAVQLRDKSRDAAALLPFGLRLRAWTKERRVALVVNGDPALARRLGADGVHLPGGMHDVADARRVAAAAWVSVAAHDDADVERARELGADAALVSPIFTTPGKGEARGEVALRHARAIAGGAMAVYALGGVDQSRAGLCRDAGADGVAVIRSLLASADPAAEARAIVGAFLDSSRPPELRAVGGPHGRLVGPGRED
jgi:thiamine-phosphate pyrophosphorylase